MTDDLSEFLRVIEFYSENVQDPTLRSAYEALLITGSDIGRGAMTADDQIRIARRVLLDMPPARHLRLVQP